MPARLRLFTCVLLIMSVGCAQAPPDAPPVTVIDVPATGDEGGALSGGPAMPAAPKPATLEGTDWPEVVLESGQARILCHADAAPVRAGPAEASATAAEGGAEQPALQELSFREIDQALAPCEESGLVRLLYSGKIASDFTALVERVSNVASRRQVDRRVLELDSAGGHVEAAMKAGDAIGASRWTIRVKENANCHSACVLILAAGDHRDISGRVGVHRMLRIGSSATTREELTNELREVHARMKDYLERNGAAVAVADLMMTVPNRKLRLLNPTELLVYGLEGTNAVQDDLERIQLTRKCGDDFVRRKDDYDRAFGRRCGSLEQDMNAMDACGLELRQGFGFPDTHCPVESPLSHHDRRPAGSGQAGFN